MTLFRFLSLLVLPLTVFSCNSNSQSECVCYEIYAPVCGTDGITYSNDCYARCAGVDFTDGMCPQTTEAFIRDLGPVAADGCGWMVELLLGDAVQMFHPENLDAEFQVDGLRVSITYRQKLENFRCGLAGDSFSVLEILNMEKI